MAEGETVLKDIEKAPGPAEEVQNAGEAGPKEESKPEQIERMPSTAELLMDTLQDQADDAFEKLRQSIKENAEETNLTLHEQYHEHYQTQFDELKKKMTSGFHERDAIITRLEQRLKEANQENEEQVKKLDEELDLFKKKFDSVTLEKNLREQELQAVCEQKQSENENLQNLIKRFEEQKKQREDLNAQRDAQREKRKSARLARKKGSSSSIIVEKETEPEKTEETEKEENTNEEVDTKAQAEEISERFQANLNTKSDAVASAFDDEYAQLAKELEDLEGIKLPEEEKEKPSEVAKEKPKKKRKQPKKVEVSDTKQKNKKFKGVYTLVGIDRKLGVKFAQARGMKIIKLKSDYPKELGIKVNDQIQSVNGQFIGSLKYDKAIKKLKKIPKPWIIRLVRPD